MFTAEPPPVDYKPARMELSRMESGLSRRGIGPRDVTRSTLPDAGLMALALPGQAQEDRAPQLRGVGFIGIAIRCAEGRRFDLPCLDPP